MTKEITFRGIDLTVHHDKAQVYKIETDDVMGLLKALDDERGDKSNVFMIEAEALNSMLFKTLNIMLNGK
jgi:hypothetical protein